MDKKKNLSSNNKPTTGTKQAKRGRKFKPGSDSYNQKLRSKGLVPPQPTSQAEFLKLQKQYYKKLYASGFKDLENVNLETGIGHDNDFLRGSATKARPWRPEKAQYYRLLRAYVAHVKIHNKMNRYIVRQLAEGTSYRKILKECRKEFKLKKSLYWFYYHCEQLIRNCMHWHTYAKEGLLNPAYQDSWADDALLADIGLQDSFLGLPVDSELGKTQTNDWYKKYGN